MGQVNNLMPTGIPFFPPSSAFHQASGSNIQLLSHPSSKNVSDPHNVLVGIVFPDSNLPTYHKMDLPNVDNSWTKPPPPWQEGAIVNNPDIQMQEDSSQN